MSHSLNACSHFEDYEREAGLKVHLSHLRGITFRHLLLRLDQVHDIRALSEPGG